MGKDLWRLSLIKQLHFYKTQIQDATRDRSKWTKQKKKRKLLTNYLHSIVYLVYVSRRMPPSLVHVFSLASFLSFILHSKCTDETVPPDELQNLIPTDSPKQRNSSPTLFRSHPIFAWGPSTNLGARAWTSSQEMLAHQRVKRFPCQLRKDARCLGWAPSSSLPCHRDARVLFLYYNYHKALAPSFHSWQVCINQNLEKCSGQFIHMKTVHI